MKTIFKKAGNMAGIARLLVLAVLFSIGNAAMAQTNYTSAILRYMRANGQMEQFGEMEKAAVQIIALLRSEVKTIPASTTNEQLAKKYAEEQFPTDIASIMSVKLRDEVSVKEINQLSELLETPAGQLAVAHGNKMNEDENLADMMAQIGSDMADILQGKTPKPVKVTASAERKKLFHNYYQASIAQLIEPMIKMYFPEDDGSETYKNATKYMMENMEPLMLNASEGILTDDDLHFYNKLVQYPQFKKLANGVKDILSDPTNLGMQMVMKVSTWLQDQ